MVVEVIVNRGWAVWLDGRKPMPGWDAPNENGEFTRPPSFARTAGGDVLNKITFMRQCGMSIGLEDDWTDEDEFGIMRPAWVIVRVNDISKMLKITHIVYGSGTSATDLLVTTGDGQQHDIDEVTTYIRAEAA